MGKNKLLAVGWLLLLPHSLLKAQNTLFTDTFQISIQHIYDIDFTKEEYKIEFWLKIHAKDSGSLVNLENQLAVEGSKEIAIRVIPNWNETSSNAKDSIYRGSDNGFRKQLRIKCTMIKHWNLDAFPFDNQYLDIIIYNPAKSAQYYLVKSGNFINYNDSIYNNIDSYIDSSKIPIGIENGWAFHKCSAYAMDTSLNDVFGGKLKSGQNKEYSAIHYHLTIFRENPWFLFWKLLLGMYIAFAVAYIALYIDIKETHVSFDLPVGGLFAAIANKYIIESSLPQTPSFTLVDILHSITIIFILIIIIYSARLLYIIKTKPEKEDPVLGEVELKMSNSKKAAFIKRAHEKDKHFIIILSSVYFLLNILVIFFEYSKGTPCG